MAPPVQIVDELVALAGPGGPHADTLLLVCGDHGQTDSGDHGGGSAPEVKPAENGNDQSQGMREATSTSVIG
jgi:hypothetical protein